MLPKGARGRDAERRLRCFIGVPEEKGKEKLEALKEVENKGFSSFITIEELSKKLGAKW